MARTRSANIVGALITANGIVNSSGIDVTGQSSNAYAQANSAYSQANSGFNQANSSFAQSNLAYAQANSGYAQANSSFAQSNLAYDQANSAYGQANLAYNTANNSNLKSGGLISGTLNVTNDMIVGGNIYLQGNTTFINVSTYQVNDPLMYIAANNILTDSVDIGFVGAKNTSGTFSHTGLARDATDGKYKLFDNLPDSGHIGNVIDFANSTIATLVANIESNSITLLGNTVATQTNLNSVYNQANAAYAQANSGYNQANSAYGAANTAQTNAGNAYSQANSAFSAANNAVLKSGDTMTGALNIAVGGNWQANLTGTSAAAYTQLYLNGTSRQYGIGVGGGSESTYGVANDFFLFDHNAGAMRAVVKSSGNVGIGTASPAAKLHVTGGIRVANTDARITFVPQGGGANNLFAIDNTSGALRIFREDYNAAGNGANGVVRMYLTDAGNLGIGTTSPQQKLHISGTDGIGFGGSASDKKLYSPLDGDLEWMTHSAASGKGFAVSHQGTKYVYLSVSGVSYLTGGGFSVGTTANPGTGAIYATGDITAFYSDDRLKTKLGNIDGALNKVLSLNGFYFEPNETAINLGYEVKKQVGVSAQEVQAVLPEVVVPAPIDQEYMTVHYHKIVPLLIEAIKELNKKIENLTK